MPRTRSTHISTTKFPAIMAWTVKVNGVKVGIVRLRETGQFAAVAGHDKLGLFDSKVQAVDAVAAKVMVVA